MENPFKLQKVEINSQKLDDELRKLGLKIKHHEENLKFLKSEIDEVQESISDLQMNIGKHHSLSAALASNDSSILEAEEHTSQSILKQENAAAGVICQLKARHGMLPSKLAVTKDVLGVVAMLAKVDNDNLSSLLSEYLGLENMLAIVCNTYGGVKAFEKYEKEGIVDRSSGIHGLGQSIGRPLNGRFNVFCLENTRPFVGEINADDPQRKLRLLKPRLPNGEAPPGFMGFAVNMISLDHVHLRCLTAGGHGLRETLFYRLFSRMQVYKTRADMERAIPCISDGAISLDGGIVKCNGLFYLGHRTTVEVKFPVSNSITNLPESVIQMEEKMKHLNWRKERLCEDKERETTLLKNAKELFDIQRRQLLEYLS